MSEAPPTSSPPPGGGTLWGSHSGGGVPAPPSGSSRPQPGPGGDRLEPLSRRLLQVAGGLSMLLLLVLANSFLNDSGSEDPLELNPVAAAAERVEKCPGMRATAYVVYSFPGLPRPVTGSGSGAFNVRTERSRFTLDLEGPNGERMRFVEINDGEVKYEGGGLVEARLPPGKEWVRTDKSDDSDDPSLSVEDSLAMLDSTGAPQMVARESVNGKMVRRYRSELEIGDLVAILREQGRDEEADAYEGIEGIAPTGISAEAWIDRRNLLRRMRMVLPMPSGEPGEPPVTMDMRMDFFDFGAQPQVQIPDPDRVVEGPLEDAPSSGSIA